MVVGTRCDVFEPILFGEGFEFSTCVQRTTVRHNYIGNPISSHVCLKFPDHSGSLNVIQPVDLEEAREIIHNHHVTRVVKVKNVCGNFGLRAIWNVMTDERLLMLPCTVGRTRFTLGSEIVYVTLHIGPIDRFSSAP